MKRVYLGNTELTALGVGGGGGDDTQKWVDYFNGTLTEFTVPEGVKKINTATFYSFTGLTSLTLPSSIESIDKTEMMGMHGEANPFGTLKTMTVKATTPPTLGNGAIPSTIETIYVPAASVDSYKSANKWSNYDDKIQAIAQNETVVIYNDGTSKEFSIIGELTKDKIENITDATKVYIGNSVTSIGDYGFQNCASLTDITIPNSVTEIDNYVFMYCTKLKSITIPESVTSIKLSTFFRCDDLTSAIISSTVASIGQNSFYDCEKLTSVTIKNSTSKIEYTNNAFNGISSSARLFVPSNLLSDYQADSNWTGAFKGGIYAIGTSMKVTYTDGSTKIFTGLTSIESDTDSNKTNAKSVEIFNGVKEIGSTAFYECSSLTDITIPNSVKKINMTAFGSCSSLNSITIPNSVKELGGYVFQDCRNLVSIDIGSSISRLEERDFRRCTSLASVTIRNSTTKVTFNTSTYGKTFEGTPSSKKLYVPSNLLSDYQSDSNWTNEFKGGIYAIQ